MVEGGQCPAFVFEAPEPVRSSCGARAQDLDGHLSFEPWVSSAIDLTHASRAEEGADLVRAEP